MKFYVSYYVSMIHFTSFDNSQTRKERYKVTNN